MRLPYRILVFFFFISKGISAQNTSKPWAYWWWPGSAVNKIDINYNLQKYAKAGFGGLHIIPIYGVKGEEAKFINYLDKNWVEILEYTVTEAKKLNLGIDMSLGTGWPYGGPNVGAEFGAKSLVLNQNADSSFTANYKNTNQKVKRAAPGGEGLVVDHFNKKAVDHYFQKFDSVFLAKNIGVRAFYNDSYEVYGANWTPDFLQQFSKLRKYDLQPNLGSLAKKDNFTEIDKRIWSDYQETISNLLLSEFTESYSNFSKKHHKLSRNEAHGSPANILDLYAAVDIPETEFFGSKPYNIPFYRQDPDYEESRFGKPNLAVLKLASSPANLLGKKLVSSETATWLGNHFKVSLSQIKPIIDESFLGGVNHIFFHGIPYTPANEPFPGWLFYASTNFNFNSHFWPDLPLLNKYIERCQSILQSTEADNDVLLYFPIYDLWQQPKENLNLIDVHNIEKSGMFTTKYRETINILTQNGYAFDFISDRQILALSVGKNGAKYAKNDNQKYKVLVVPSIEILPLTTLNKILKLKELGFKIIFIDKLPQKVNGYYNWQKRQKDFDINVLKNVTSDLLKTLIKFKIRSENLNSLGLSFIRKRQLGQTTYFIANQQNTFKSGTIALNSIAKKNVSIFDANNNIGRNINYKIINNQTVIDLNLLPGQSVFVKIDSETKNKIYTANNVTNYLRTQIVGGPWQLEFIDGAPFLPKPQQVKELISWTYSSDTSAKYFSGLAKYTIKFDLPKSAVNQPAILQLGDVRETANVQLNGVDIGTAWSLPFELNINKGILKTENTLTILVRNLSINRVIYLDKTKYPWQKFYDINMVDINYKPFNASNWSFAPSGLLGPVVIKY
jgi:alpha-L-rhamnosidase